jgi:hypothetical protein
LYDSNQDEVPCPPRYPDRKIFFKGYDDTRDCSPCSCGPPVGSKCTSQISVYSNSTCSGIPVLDVTHGDEGCYNMMDGVALGSKKASPPVYTPGTCEPSGGEPTGSAVETSPILVCCLP